MWLLVLGAVVTLASGAHAHALQRSRGSQQWRGVDAVLCILFGRCCSREVRHGGAHAELWLGSNRSDRQAAWRTKERRCVADGGR
jgi:hypothetical protein